MSRLPIPRFIQEIKAKLGFDRTMTASGEDVVDAVNKQSQQIDNLQAADAYVENGDTAQLRTYAAGDFIMWKGILYTVNNEGITQGTAITGHVTKVTDGGLNTLTDRINALNNKINNTDFKNMITGIKSEFTVVHATRSGNVIDIDFYTNAAANVTAWTDDLMTLPYAPKSEVYALFTTGTVCSVVRVSGKINVNKTLTIPVYTHCHVTFIAG